MRHQVDDSAVGVELGRRVAGVVGKLLDQVLVSLTQYVRPNLTVRKRQAGEVLDEVAQELVREALLV